MREMTKTELEQVEGGGIGVTAIFIIGAIITLIAGIIDGFTNPVPCRGGKNG